MFRYVFPLTNIIIVFVFWNWWWKEKISPKEGSFLNPNNSIVNNNFNLGLYNKRGKLTLSIARTPFLFGNYPSTGFLALQGIEILKIAIVTISVASLSDTDRV